jgi:hypothetical protein
MQSSFGPLLARRDLLRFGTVGVAASALPPNLPAVPKPDVGRERRRIPLLPEGKPIPGVMG